ncbi:glutamate receptor 2.8-like [Cornus florida]|uniref:glutamate receptor 2.8-like n=1 Tax=Cornus florida TaxID=4283 RepID=UPI00289D9314|nr:glutamate receptor 2.8-like [Cornus florida]
MGLCFPPKTAWAPLYFLFHALLILSTIAPVNSNTEAEANYIKMIYWTSPPPILKIGIPIRTFSDRFVRIQTSINNPDEKTYAGFSIDLFVEVMKTLSFHLPYQFVEFDGTYDDLLTCVANQTFDAAVGDITITADRSRVVDFTLPYTEQGRRLLLMVSVNPQPPNLCLFLKPFTVQLWFAVWSSLIYTMFIVWFFEHPSNPEFHGRWITFSSLFFAHKGRIQSNYTRVVVVVWLIVVVILIQSYVASLTSMLTVTRLHSVLEKNSKTKYLDGEFHFKELYNSREDIATESHYVDAFKSGKISAAFLEVPYAKAIDSHYCNQLVVTQPMREFGGFGFVFQKGSPIVHNISTAILSLMQDGTLKKLEDEYFTPSSDCSNFQTAKNNSRLSLQHFRGLFIFYLAISTICILLFVKQHRREVLQEGNITPTPVSAWKK